MLKLFLAIGIDCRDLLCDKDCCRMNVILLRAQPVTGMPVYLIEGALKDYVFVKCNLTSLEDLSLLLAFSKTRCIRKQQYDLGLWKSALGRRFIEIQVLCTDENHHERVNANCHPLAYLQRRNEVSIISAFMEWHSVFPVWRFILSSARCCLLTYSITLHKEQGRNIILSFS